MKFTDGQWLLQPGVTAHYAAEARSVAADGGELVVHAPVRPIVDRGDTLQGPLLTVTLSSPLPDIVRVRIEHFTGGLARGPQIPLVPQADVAVDISDGAIVFRAIEARRGPGEAVLFARSSYASGQRFPVHWGGDCWSTFESMAESLRGGLSLSLCGFGFWSHDIGGFEGTAPASIYKRWAAFGLLSSHSRLHGSASYRIPWAYDEEACDVLRLFTKLKCRLMPYLWSAALEAHREGVPMLRAMLLEFPDDPACDTLDRQYLLGRSLLVAPVFTEDGTVDYYLPAGRWTNLLTGQVQEGWRREQHDFLCAHECTPTVG